MTVFGKEYQWMTNQIEKMPVELKRKPRKFNRLVTEASFLDAEIQADLKKARVPYDYLVKVLVDFKRKPLPI